MEKVFLSKCENYNREEVYSAIDKIFDMAGGIGKVVNKNDKVF
ncbi:hypothetical protein [Caloramator sp. Dgby_cultured_2]|nr:hypothetical protein [Caloramator sp. Dgby_cultured_2]WDU83799.1 hypothetical protein PWK10_04480 [Caloramator sp. Dgby_cultured_2]